jgi:hypothetical protein
MSGVTNPQGGRRVPRLSLLEGIRELGALRERVSVG